METSRFNRRVSIRRSSFFPMSFMDHFDIVQLLVAEQFKFRGTQIDEIIKTRRANSRKTIG